MSDDLPTPPTPNLRSDSLERLQELFEAALACPDTERAPFLAEACTGDPSLRSQVEGMLAAEEEAEARIAGVVQGTLELARSEHAEAGVGQRIGPYRVLSELGRGGMSTVYLAERADEHYRQQVAIKVVRRGMDSRDLPLRLRRERQILARLEHPNIARLLDGGNTEDGLPYFVMDPVEGEAIDRYCDRRRLTVPERLGLFLEVCSAVQYAHANLVIHRDLKPSNLLIATGGVPKLLDFGIAKLLDPGLAAEMATELATPTAPELRLLTPEYASPEQVRGEPLSVATDVYSLGVLLYELLTGRRPYPVDRRRQRQLEQVICEMEPERPSAVVLRPVEPAVGRTSLATPKAVSAARATTPEKLRRQLAGDLDTVVLAALRKEPERRYASVEALAEDLRRHLEGLPVTARGDTLGYRAGKFLRRHKRAVALAAGVLLLIAGLIGFYTSRLADERDHARREERESAEVARLLVELFESADPGVSRGEELSARDLLDAGAVRIRAELWEPPKLRAEMLHVIARSYMALGEYDEADLLLEESETILRDRHGAERRELAENFHLRGRWLLFQSRYEKAERHFRDALEMRRRLLGSEHTEVAESLAGLAGLLYARGEHKQAEELIQQVLDIRSRLHGLDHRQVAASWSHLAAVLYEMGNHATAERLLRRALDIQKRTFDDDDHPDVATTLSILSTVLTHLDHMAEAEDLCRQALEMRRSLHGDEHPMVAQSLNNLGSLLRRQNKLEQAEARFREASKIRRSRGEEETIPAAETLANLAMVLRLQGRYREAVEEGRRAVEITRGIDESHPNLPTLLIELADALRELGQLEEAGKACREAVRLRRESLPAGHWKTASAQVELGRVLEERGKCREAESVLEEALPSLEAAGDEAAERLAVARTLLEDLERC